jgi:outer membrane protein assembly factor BamA
LNYQNPRLTDQDISLRTTFSYRDSHNLSNSSNEFEQINRLASLSLGKRFGLFQTLIGTIGYQLWQIPDTSLGRTVSPDGTDRFLEFGLQYTYDARNVREYPTDGFYFDATTMNNGFGRESTIQTFTYAADVRWYTIWNKFLTFAGRGFGSFVSGGVVPVYHDLFLNSRFGVQGYNQRDYQGEDIIGGSAEVRLPVIAPRFITFNFLNIHQFNTMRFGIYAALFADIGKIWFRSNLFDDVPWLASVGLGLHFLLPYSTVLRVECSTNALGQTRIDATSGVPF